jgi:periplasmic protein TonB
MPHDLFGDVNLRPASARSHRSPIVVVSILVHVAALVALCVVPLLATDTLPMPRRVIDYFLPHDVMPVVVPAPSCQTPSSNLGPAARPDSAPSTAAAAPLVAPTGITEETGKEGIAGSAGPGGPPVAGTVEGLPGGSGIEPAPPPPPTQPIRLHAGIRAPRKLVDVRPIYPEIARAAHAEGVVIIEATIDVRGNVTAARVLRSHALLEQAALEAVRQWTFTPTLLNGVPVPIIMTVTVNFTLR